jgi:hypothetical protein
MFFTVGFGLLLFEYVSGSSAVRPFSVAAFLWYLLSVEVVLVPPAAILLAPSALEALQLQSRLLYFAQTLPVVSLIDRSRLTRASMLDPIRQAAFRMADVEWPETVRLILSIAPLAIVDLRSPSSIVIEELEWALDGRSKRVIVVTNDGKLPSDSRVRAVLDRSETTLFELTSPQEVQAAVHSYVEDQATR